jgi:transposase
MSGAKDKDGKIEALRRGGAVNRHAEQVSDAHFAEEEFFDARDLVQVKYEMLRRVLAEGSSVTEAARSFGMSRFSFYQARSAYDKAGLPGLIPKKPGPRGRHKLTPEVLTFMREKLASDSPPNMRELPDRVWERFGVRVHQRTIERALSDVKKKLHASTKRDIRSTLRQASRGSRGGRRD